MPKKVIIHPSSDVTMDFADTHDHFEESEEAVKPELTLTSLGRFELKAVLGEGGFGRVYLAYDPHLDQLVALKVSLLDSAKKKHRDRILKEARAASLLRRHDAIVPAYECAEDKGFLYIVFEYIEGMSLSSRLRQGSVDRRQAVEWIRVIAGALQFAHENNLIHRDVKPHNILISAQARPFITDFGLVRWISNTDDLTEPGNFTGTIAYMAPELLDGNASEGDTDGEPVARQENHDRAVDQYSLGVVLFECLTGHRPFEGHASAVVGMKVSQPPPPPSRHDPSIPKELDAICLKAIQKHPKHRYPDCAAFAEALKGWLEQHSKETAPDDEPLPVRQVPAGTRTRKNWTAIWQVSAVSVLLLAVAAIVYVWPPQPVADPVPPEQLDLPTDAASTADSIREMVQEQARQRDLKLTEENSLGMLFSLIPSGKFEMGCSGKEYQELERRPEPYPRVYVKDIAEKAMPSHIVQLTKPVYMAQTEVTQAMFKEFKDSSEEDGAQQAGEEKSYVTNVSYQEALEFCKWLSGLEKEKAVGRHYRLPTDAEWEFARRAEIQGSNALGVQNMRDGVGEWCSDWFREYKRTIADAKTNLTDPTGPDSGTERVIRGSDQYGTPSYRDSALPVTETAAIRIVLELVP